MRLSEIEIVRKIRKRAKIILICGKYVLMREMAYPASFVMGILVDLGYQITFVALFIFLYQNVTMVAGWSYYEMLLLLAIDMVISEIMVGTVLISNVGKIPQKIKNGKLDMFLVKPLPSLFHLSVSDLYPPPIANGVIGIAFILFVISRLISSGATIYWGNILGAIGISICGIIIMYCLNVIIVTLSFYFPENKTLTIIAQNLTFEFTNRPHTIFRGLFKYMFFVFIPVVYASSIPAFTVINGINYNYLIGAVVLALLFFLGMNWFWKLSIKRYSSASS